MGPPPVPCKIFLVCKTEETHHNIGIYTKERMQMHISFSISLSCIKDRIRTTGFSISATVSFPLGRAKLDSFASGDKLSKFSPPLRIELSNFMVFILTLAPGKSLPIWRPGIHVLPSHRYDSACVRTYDPVGCNYGESAAVHELCSLLGETDATPMAV